jgi:hypothetical protein
MASMAFTASTCCESLENNCLAAFVGASFRTVMQRILAHCDISSLN